MRFVYRTHIYIKEEILEYKPSAGDLSYPEKLETMEKIANSLKKNTSDTDLLKEANNKHTSPADAHGMWFPTLKRTLICLSKLFRCLEVKHTNIFMHSKSR